MSSMDDDDDELSALLRLRALMAAALDASNARIDTLRQRLGHAEAMRARQLLDDDDGEDVEEESSD